MAGVKIIKDTVGDALQKGIDIIEGGTRQVVGAFAKQDPIKQYKSDILLQTGVGATKNILKTSVDIFENNEIGDADKIVLLQDVLQKTKSSCVKYRVRFYQSLLSLKIADATGERDFYLAAIDGFNQAIGEYYQQADSSNTESDTVARKWGQFFLELLTAIGKEYNEDLHALTGGLMGSDEDDSEKELAKSFKESSAHNINNIEVNEYICVSFCHFWIAYCYEKVNQAEDARLWYIRALSSKSAIIRNRAKEGYYRMNTVYSQSFIEKSPASRANIILFQSLEAMAGFNDALRIIIPFDIAGIPTGLTFSTDRPRAGVLYQIHPCRDLHYVEYERYDRIIFDEQVSDFLRLCQGVGADSIKFEVLEGQSIENNELSVFASELNIGLKDEKGGAGFKTNSSSNSQSRRSSFSGQTIKLGHLKKLIVPTDLIWEGKEGWREGNDLIKNYRSGIRLTDYTAYFKTSSYQKEHLASEASLKASYSKMALTVSGSINQSEDTTFTRKDKLEWALHVHFAKRGFAGFIERLLRYFKKSKA